MNGTYGDGSDCEKCEVCGYCITCGDCKVFGCGVVAEILRHDLKESYKRMREIDEEAK